MVEPVGDEASCFGAALGMLANQRFEEHPPLATARIAAAITMTRPACIPAFRSESRSVASPTAHSRMPSIVLSLTTRSKVVIVGRATHYKESEIQQ